MFNNAGVKIWVQQIRLHQWLKNTLIFTPLMVSGLFQDVGKLLPCLLGFASFSLMASSTYIINDILDLSADRYHPQKKLRPIANGNIEKKQAFAVATGLSITSILLALFLSQGFLMALLGYSLLALLYSVEIKKHAGIDITTLTLLYIIRIAAGAYLINVPLSFWLITFSMFVFLSLALVKRCSEIKSFEKLNKQEIPGRGYLVSDYPVLRNIGTSSAMLSILTLCFFIKDGVLAEQYPVPWILWPIVPCLCYWFIRVWIKTDRGLMTDDPIVYSISDKSSLVCISFCCAITLTAQLL